MSLTELLKRALLVHAVEVKLIPGRRTVVVTADGENEVRGAPQTPERINELLESVLTTEARRGLASGWAEWEFDLAGRGMVRATAQLKVGLVHAAFFLDRCYEAGTPDHAGFEPVAPAPPAQQAEALREPDGAVEHVVPDLDSDRSLPKPPPRPQRRPLPSAAALAPTQPSVRIPVLPTQPPLPPTRQGYEAGLSSGSTTEIDSLLEQLLKLDGSDLHATTGAVPMVRTDGDMRSVPGRVVLKAEVLQRMLWPIVPPRNREEFTKCHDTDFAYELEGRARFRVNLFVDLKGMGAVFRVIPSRILTAEDLALPKELLGLCQLPKGLVLVTGPTGSGKSTTLAALVDHINTTRSAHIITIEDPVEFVHQNKKCLVNQRQVGEHTGSFKAALRAALREDPDIVLLGEMRDLETVAIALETAETGHLVFGTLHTSSAPATVDRIIDQFPANEQNQIRVMLSNSLKGVVCQMLCKKIGGGRVAALEMMFCVPAIANLIREQKVFQIPSIIQTARNSGMRLMNDSLLQLVKGGTVTVDEALSKSTDRSTLIALLKQNNIAV
jgi:twitching motility protein PilT